MTFAAVINMIFVMGAMTSLLGWSISKVLSVPDSEEHIHPPVELDTPDMHEK